MKTLYLSGIRHIGEATYLVEFRDDSEGRYGFEMRVEPGPIEVLTWAPEFASFFEEGTSPMKPVFAAVMAFHAAVQVAFVAR